MFITKYDVLIIGAGVIGCSIAKYLPESMHIGIIDRNIEGMNASFAAGGMLGAQNEFYEDSSLYRLSMQGRARMKAAVTSLEDATGIQINYQKEGLIKILTDAAYQNDFNQQFEFLRSKDSNIKRMTREELIHLIPDIDAQEGLWIPDDAQIDAKQYTTALRHFISHKTHIDMIFSEVKDIRKHHDYDVTTENNIFTAKRVIIAAGAWSDELCSLLDINIPVKGMRGEVLYLHHPQLKLKQTLFGTNGCYIVPKHDDHYLIGATTNADKEVKITEAGRNWLLSESRSIIPSLKSATVKAHWSGVRPYASNLIMDEICDGLFLATGHYRNGILLSDITGYYMAELLQSRRHPQINAFKLGGSYAIIT